MLLFLAADGDAIGKLVGKARLEDNVEELRRVSQAIERGNKVFESYALASGGSVIESGGDELLIEVQAAALKDLESVRNQYSTATNATISVGIGKKPSEASKALLVAKLRGRNRSVFYDDDVEKEFQEAAQEPEDEKNKIVKEYLSKAEGTAKPSQAQTDVIASNTLSVPGAPQTQETVQGAVNQGALPAPGQPLTPDQLNAQAQPQLMEQPPSIPESKQAFKDHADKHEAKQRAEKLKSSDTYKSLKEKVAQALEKVKEQLPNIATLRDSAPDAYEAVLGIVQGLIALGRQFQSTDERLEKTELLLKGVPTSLSQGNGNFVDNDSLGYGLEMGKTDLLPGGKADKKKPEEFDPEQLAIGTQHELEHTQDQAIAQEIAMDHLVEDPNYYKHLTKSEGEDNFRDVLLRDLQYDGPIDKDSHFFTNAQGQRYVFQETTQDEALAAEAANEIARVLIPEDRFYPVVAYNMVGRWGIMEPYLDFHDLGEVPPQQLTQQEKQGLMEELFVDWLVGNMNITGRRLLRSPNGHIISLCKKDAFKDFETIGAYYEQLLSSLGSGTLLYDVNCLNPMFSLINSVPDEEFLEIVGRYAQTKWPDDVEAQLNFAKLLLLRKRNCQILFSNFVKQGLNKAERPEYGKMRAHIDSPVGAVIFGKVKVRHWDGTESWKSIKSGAIMGLDPGVAGEGHPVSAKNPTAK